jgi:pimeloyl-ACP methyl ester carboxylesterase
MNDQVQFFSLETSAHQRRLAYRFVEGRRPALIWLGGFASDMTSTKATALAIAASEAGLASLRFDYSGHGASSGDFTQATISLWLEESLAMIEAFGGERPILIGSSMGGWLALLASLRLKALGKAPAGLVLIAPAVDFTEKLIWAQLPDDLRKKIMKTGVWHRESAYSADPHPITRALIEDGRKHLLMGTALHFGLPIHILQGAEDPDVPRAHVEAFAAGLMRDDLRLTLIPDGNHRLSRESDIATLIRITLDLAKECG